MSSRTTIRDVSRAAGVSVATVSNVLNAPDRVAEETRRRVTEAIDQLGYRPNRAARSLPQGRSFTIGYCIPDGKERFALDTFLHQLTERASDSDMDILLFTPHRGQSEADSYREIVRRGAVDGFIVSSTVHDDERVQVLVDAAIPVVSFGRTDLADLHSWVDVDGRAGTRAAVEHLVEQGHQRLSLVAWPEGSISGDERAAGFVEGLAEAGLEVDPGHVIRVENDVESGREAAARLLDLDPAPTAIVAVQDVLAAGVVAELNARGIRGGKDVAVTGFDDSPPAIYSTPSITSVRQPIEAIGRRVVEFLMHDLEGSDGVSRSALVEPELVIRESSIGWEEP
ncbi:MAG TPA: LacI family DNA-binding transcriptional regulator [Acidimicrobiia bacterium]|nr:LacI family DNA-binding transcriptional regulator [Acidimicrobiia bacterium]